MDSFPAKKLLFVLLITFFITPLYLFAQNLSPRLKLDLPLFDYPYQIDAMNTVDHGFFGSYANPSMNQSLALTTDLISGFNFGMQYFYENSKINQGVKIGLYIAGLGLGSFLLTYSPGFDGWLHEEYHRAVMTHYGINSFNGMNLFPVGAELISVSSIKDEDLIRLKEKSPADMVRLHAAGIEGGYQLINNLQRNNFFYEQEITGHIVNYWMITTNSHFYISMAASPSDVDVETAKMNREETTIASRDFTGFDPIGWVYDLFRPNEPYEARGVHPSGVGINRYRTTKDLTNDELNYLRMQSYLHFINYLSPMLYGFPSIMVGDGVYGNFAMRHLLTSFGSDISAQIFLKYGSLNFAFALHNYLNYKNYFPAIEAELVDYPFHLGDFGMFLSPRIIIGIQPENQKFKTGKPEFLGLFGLRIDFMMSNNFLPFLDFTAKTDGWVAGNVYLDKNISLIIGVSLRF